MAAERDQTATPGPLRQWERSYDGNTFRLAVKSAETVKANLSTAAGRIAAGSVIVVLLAGVLTAIVVIRRCPNASGIRADLSET